MADERQPTVGVPTETYPGEARVALVPTVVPALTKAGFKVIVQSGAGEAAGLLDSAYEEKGATIGTREEVFEQSDVILQVRAYSANAEHAKSDLNLMRKDQVVIGLADPLTNAEDVAEMAKTGATVLSTELMPRITRAQSMDVLSSQATVGGYKAVLTAASSLPKMFPMLTTAAGTLRPAKVFVIGAGVAGLQAIATARRLGAVVEAYDVRAAVKEQVQSVGAKFVEMDLEADAEDKGGYAKEMGEEFIRKQRELMSKVVAANDVVITTAAIPGKRSPLLVTEDMVKLMQPGSVIVDLAAERGGNCEITEADKTVVKHGVTIHGPTNLPATVPFHASSMYAKNLQTFLLHLAPKGEFAWDMEDQITNETLLARDGEVVHPRLRESLGLAAPAEPAEPAAQSAPASAETVSSGASKTTGS